MTNIFLCWKHKLVPPDRIKAFLGACVSASPASPEETFHEVCGMDDGTRVLFFGLAALGKRKVNAKARLSSTLKTATFHRFLLARKHKIPSLGRITKVLSLAPRTLAEEQEYVDDLKDITSRPDWSESGATLGRPFPNPLYCWFTLTRPMAQLANKKLGSSTKATTIRDALGLIDSEDGEFRLEISFSAQSLKVLPNVTVARPTFADGGNSRFAAFQDGAICEQNYSRGWGTAVNLEKLAQGHTDMSGLPERVSTAVPIDPSFFVVEYIGRVSGTRGLTASVDDHAAFEKRLRGSTTAPEIIEQLTKVGIS
jgi:hypothetical protein